MLMPVKWSVPSTLRPMSTNPPLCGRDDGAEADAVDEVEIRHR